MITNQRSMKGKDYEKVREFFDRIWFVREVEKKGLSGFASFKDREAFYYWPKLSKKILGNGLKIFLQFLC